MSDIGGRLADIQSRIRIAARQAGRNPDEVTLIGVSKTHPPETVRAALDAGLTHFGENRVQEAEAKIVALADVRDRITWHLIGHLQRNKAKKAVALFDLVHTVDSVDLARALSRGQGSGVRDQEAASSQQSAIAPSPLHPFTPSPVPLLVQVNVSGEASKEGFDLAGWEDDVTVLDRFRAKLEQILALNTVEVRGLMTIAPWTDDTRVPQAVFRSTRRLRDALARFYTLTNWAQLSMGMSDDFETAIAEGATMVRIGRAIFGSRD